jgi:two-component system, LytTR family, sensor kinase
MMKILDLYRKRNYTHVAVWSVFIFYETIIVGLIYGVFASPLTYILHYIIIISFFYFHADIILPWIFKKKRNIFWKFPFAIAFSLAVYVILHNIADEVLIKLGAEIDNGEHELDREYILRNLFRGIYFMLFATGYFLYKIREVERIEKQELERVHMANVFKNQKIESELAESRNAYLKAQINPHFLFNTLDFVYHSISVNPEVASEAVIHLSRMMRFAIDSDKNRKLIKLSEEIGHAQTLFHIFQLRKHNFHLPVIECSKQLESANFIPLVVLTLAENMIKHGDFSHKNESVFKLLIDKDHLIIINKNRSYFEPSENSNSLGLENIKKRLVLAYGENISFSYLNQELNFELCIKIPIDQIIFFN